MVEVMPPEVSMVMPSPFGERKQRLDRFLGYEGQVDLLWSERPLVDPAEQEQCFSEFDRSGVDGFEAFDEFAIRGSDHSEPPRAASG